MSLSVRRNRGSVKHYVASRRYRQVPNRTFTRNPTTTPICMRFLQSINTFLFPRLIWRYTHENTTPPVTSISLPFSHPTAGFGSLIKKNGSNGKKKPNTMPCRIDALPDEDDWERDAVLALSRESIHCSSRARACSSSGSLRSFEQR